MEATLRKAETKAEATIKTPTAPVVPWGDKLFERITSLAILLTFAFIGTRAFFSFNHTFDYTAYHLPFALNHFGLTTYEPDDYLVWRYQTFPPLAHYVQGLLVWLTGSFNLANSINFIAVAILTTLLRFVISPRMDLRWWGLGLLATPLVVMHLPSGLIDLWTASFLALAALALPLLLVHGRFSKATGLIAIGLGVACLSKNPAWPPAAVIGSAAMIRILRLPKENATRKAKALALTAIIGSSLIWPIRNWVVLNNPAAPHSTPGIIANALGLSKVQLPPSGDLTHAEISNRYAGWTRPQVFLVSALDINYILAGGVSAFSDTQWTPGLAADPNYRMSGWFAPTVIFLIAMLVLFARRKIVDPLLNRTFIAVTLVVSMMPQSHELRYWLVIPLMALGIIARYATQALSPRARSWGTVWLITCASLSAGVCVQWREPFQSFEDLIPAEAKVFIKEHPSNHEATGAGIRHLISQPRPFGIYWSGPGAATIHVKNTPIIQGERDALEMVRRDPHLRTVMSRW